MTGATMRPMSCNSEPGKFSPNTVLSRNNADLGAGPALLVTLFKAYWNERARRDDI